jgi:hypothetical protein
VPIVSRVFFKLDHSLEHELRRWLSKLRRLQLVYQMMLVDVIRLVFVEAELTAPLRWSGWLLLLQLDQIVQQPLLSLYMLLLKQNYLRVLVPDILIAASNVLHLLRRFC